MTLQEIVDAFEQSYKIEATAREITPVVFPRGIEVMWLSQAIQDLQFRIKELQSTYVLTLTGALSYSLPLAFGGLIKVTQNDIPLDVVSPENIPQSPAYTTAQKCAVSNDGSGSGWQLVFDVAPTETIVVSYYNASFLYSPSKGSQQSWGTFDGNVLVGLMVLDGKYEPAIEAFMLSKALGGNARIEFMQLYEKHVNELLARRLTSENVSLQYNFGR